MNGYPIPEVERAMKVQAVILKAISGQLQRWQAAEILGVSCRTMRRWKQRCQQYDYDGLFDRRHRRPTPPQSPIGDCPEGLASVPGTIRGLQRRPLPRPIASAS